ncbi:MAG: cytochrome c oxidase assembly protein [Candidatus Acidiferrales bacterium]|jgi:putative membrane protein
MTLALHDALQSWSLPIGVNVAIVVSLLIYIRGWLRIRRTGADAFSFSRLVVFACGMLALWLAIGSPLEALDDSSLVAHMVQHLLLMLAAPPLILLGAPALPFLHGLPSWFVRVPLGAFLRSRAVQKFGEVITEPLFCWIAAMVVMIGWHVPAAFELALRSDGWHNFEHICFFVTSILFWWPVVQPWPSVARWPRWAMPIYLLLGMIAGSLVSAYMTFSDAILYPSYAHAPRIFAMSPLDDQVAAGGLMWFVMTVAFLIPSVVITVRYLSPSRPRVTPRQVQALDARAS